MKRTQDEIVERIRNRKASDFFGFESGEYVDYLDYAYAKEFLKDDTSQEQWKEAQKVVKSPEDTIKDYMSFAWEKANNCRGISASRSILHMIAWLWLDGKDWPEIEDYAYYGKPQLVRICEEYGVDWRALDDGRWVNSEDEDGITADKALKR